ncbi:hypothetical protein DFS34DRAFT_627882 [Phlyctochytrium arcticum]|nr:hypothetical protein DFS34DRAFT_627882 [Phlyctochytrium arcticum]
MTAVSVDFLPSSSSSTGSADHHNHHHHNPHAPPPHSSPSSNSNHHQQHHQQQPPSRTPSQQQPQQQEQPHFEPKYEPHSSSPPQQHSQVQPHSPHHHIKQSPDHRHQHQHNHQQQQQQGQQAEASSPRNMQHRPHLHPPPYPSGNPSHQQGSHSPPHSLSPQYANTPGLPPPGSPPSHGPGMSIPPPQNGEDYPRKLSIDTSMTRGGSYDAMAASSAHVGHHPGGPVSAGAAGAGSAPVSSYYPLPGMGSPPRRRRGDHMPQAGPFPVSVGPFFKPTKQNYNIYSMDRAHLYTLRIVPKVDRGFFLADNDWTCYRRNYFQVSSAFTATNQHNQEVDLPCIMEMNNQLYSVTGFALGISARVANGEKRIDLVQHTPKRDKGPQLVPQPKTVRSGGNPHQYNGIGTNQLVATFERLQFKTATANNGKRRAAQQYYILIINLYAQTEDGQQYKIAVTESAPLVVRGRSPGHYADGNLDALRIFPVDMHFNRRDLYGAITAPLSPYGMTSPMYSPVTPGGPMMASAAPTMMSPHGHYPPPQHPQHPGGPPMSAPPGHSPVEYQHPPQHPHPQQQQQQQQPPQQQQQQQQQQGMHHRAASGDRSMPPPQQPQQQSQHPNNNAAVWSRNRAHSLAESDASYTTSGTNATASSYNSMDFDQINAGAMAPPRHHPHIHPSEGGPPPPPPNNTGMHSPPSLSPTTLPSSSSGNSNTNSGAPIHDLISPHHPHHRPPPPPTYASYPNFPGWDHPSDPPRTPITPTTELSKMIGGFHINRHHQQQQQQQASHHHHPHHQQPQSPRHPNPHFV